MIFFNIGWDFFIPQTEYAFIQLLKKISFLSKITIQHKTDIYPRHEDILYVDYFLVNFGDYTFTKIFQSSD